MKLGLAVSVLSFRGHRRGASASDHNVASQRPRWMPHKQEDRANAKLDTSFADAVVTTPASDISSSKKDERGKAKEDFSSFGGGRLRQKRQKAEPTNLLRP